MQREDHRLNPVRAEKYPQALYGWTAELMPEGLLLPYITWMTASDQPFQAGRDPHRGLARGISEPRFGTFLAAAADDTRLARELYVWNRDLSVAVLADIAILEVALRNAMHEAATAAWGTHWYADPAVAIDARSARGLAGAWGRLPKSVKERPTDPDVPGRLVAQCMFGFWTGLLDAGGYIGDSPRRVHLDYDKLWASAFKQAFPGGREVARQQRAEARAAGAKDSDLADIAFTRSWMHGVCKIINDLRNRVAHHEPLINGFPLNGQQRRLTTAEGHEQCRALAGSLDRELASWIDANTQVPSLLQQRPA